MLKPPVADLIFLSGQTPVAVGSRRLVFVHPFDPALAIKVNRPPRQSRRPKDLFTKFRPYGPHIRTIREIREFCALEAAEPARAHIMERVHGLADTDLGLGLVTEFLRDGEGNIAPTLDALYTQHKFDAEAMAALKRFVAEFLDSGVIVGDLHPRNLVYADRGNGSEFVLVDGLGEKMFPPLNLWSRRYRRWNKTRILRRTLGWYGLETALPE